MARWNRDLTYVNTVLRHHNGYMRPIECDGSIILSPPEHVLEACCKLGRELKMLKIQKNQQKDLKTLVEILRRENSTLRGLLRDGDPPPYTPSI